MRQLIPGDAIMVEINKDQYDGYIINITHDIISIIYAVDSVPMYDVFNRETGENVKNKNLGKVIL
jgi:hypothetical protein